MGRTVQTVSIGLLFVDVIVAVIIAGVGFTAGSTYGAMLVLSAIVLIITGAIQTIMLYAFGQLVSDVADIKSTLADVKTLASRNTSRAQTPRHETRIRTDTEE